MENNEEVVISDTRYRTLSVVATGGDNVVLTRKWKGLPDKYSVDIDVISVSLTELEQILKRFNGGGKTA